MIYMDDSGDEHLSGLANDATVRRHELQGTNKEAKPHEVIINNNPPRIYNVFPRITKNSTILNFDYSIFRIVDF